MKHTVLGVSLVLAGFFFLSSRLNGFPASEPLSWTTVSGGFCFTLGECYHIRWACYVFIRSSVSSKLTIGVTCFEISSRLHFDFVSRELFSGAHGIFHFLPGIALIYFC